MKTGVTIDMRQFSKAMLDVQTVSRKTLADQCNQRAMNVSARCVETMPPVNVSAARAHVKRYMDQQISQRVRQTKKGKFVKAGRAKDQLRLKNLIAQARNAKAGHKGLYGQAMRLAAAKLSRMAQISQGFLKSVFIPVIVGLYPFVKYRPKASLTNSISRWPGSSGFGKITPAKAGLNPTAIVKLGVNVKGNQQGKVTAFYSHYVQAAINAETAEMKAHYERELEKELKSGDLKEAA